MSVDIDTVLQQANDDALYIRDSLASAYEDRCTFGECEGIHFSGCHSEFLGAACVDENPLIGECINVSCQEVRDYTFAAGEMQLVENSFGDNPGDEGFAIFRSATWMALLYNFVSLRLMSATSYLPL